MARATYTAVGVASPVTTAKTILTVLGTANFGVDLLGFEISADGAISTAVPVFWELCYLDGSTAGTAGSAITVRQEAGRVITAGFTSGANFSAEPTVLTQLYGDYLPAYNGLLVRDFQWNGTPDSAVSQGFALRVTAQSSVNLRGTFKFARC